MNLRQIKIFAFVLAVVFGVCAFFIYKTNKALSVSGEFNNALINLKLANDEMNFNLENNILVLNYDELNKNAKNFDRNLTRLLALNEQNLGLGLHDNADKLKELGEIYTKKRRFVDRSNYVSSGMAAFIIAGEYEIDKDPELKAFKPLFLTIRNMIRFDLQTVKQAQSQIDEMSGLSEQNAKQSNMLKKAKYALNSMILLNTIYTQSAQLGLGKFIENFRRENLIWYKEVFDRLKFLQSVAFVLFFWLLAFIFYQARQSVRNLRQIKLLKTTIDGGHSSIVFSDVQNKILYVNKTFEETTGYKLKEVKGKNPHVLKSGMHPESFYESMREAIRTANFWESDELISKAKDGNLIYEKAKFIPFFFRSKLEGYIAIKLNRTKEAIMLNELAVKNEQIKAQSAIDKLTGFGNYFALTKNLEAKKDGMLICMSIKNFKTLRFFYQTRIIDAMLKAIADTLKLCVDTSQINAWLFRFQDDAFYLWYNGDNIVRDIGFIKEYFSFNRLEVMIDDKHESLPSPKIVMGVSLPNDTPQTNRLMQAILANQQALDNGSGIYYYQENDAIEMQYHKNQLTTQLVEYALENDMVIVECQGIYDVEANEKEAKFYEVLVRIMDQNGKIRYPGEFLEIAMRTQLYVQITKKVIAHAFALVEKYPQYIFSINLSSSDIADRSVRKLLEEKLSACANPAHVCFEMLESEEMSDYEGINSFIKRVKSYGCKISIDDFGSGYSNYYRILELDIDNIKIDGSIIKKLPYDQNAGVLVETIVNFAKKQGYKVVAEFVSSPEILTKVQEFGIKYAQGFLLDKPKSMS
ncbi:MULTISPECIES: bifunctional diguanylate cyclase/phosphodiesterase [Campylobacter]|uniref:bifunctional diguanylate cyclase/phosphodiesterase n=1 Tax=Campylobacter TaxID=194 RepID=UPI00027A3630|nr:MULTISPECIES: GGDEF domain-containing phosphodiesterase [Campylobacter]EJP76230.1 cyclic diguanylate phosphodiesterase (EAL) domain protein [Campylobacter sp. FOBRC14]